VVGGGRGWWGVCLADEDVSLGFSFEVREGVAVGGSRGGRIRDCCGGSSLLQQKWWRCRLGRERRG
jgi:hypothetical protein